MKRKVLPLIVAMIGIYAFNVTAQQPDNIQCTAQTQCSGSNMKKDKCNRRADVFKGINLSEEQKAAIANLDKQRAEARKAACNRKQNAQKDCSQRPSRDQVDQQRMDQRLDYLHQMQSILTPEQYITYLENTAVNAPRFVGDNCGRKADMKKGDRRGDKVARNGNTVSSTAQVN